MNGDLLVDTRTTGTVTVLELAGELDGSSSPAITRLLDRAFHNTDGVVVCDVERLTLGGSPSDLLVFADALGRNGPWPRAALHLAAPSPRLVDGLHRVAMPRFVPVHASVPLALAEAERDASLRYRELVLPPAADSARATRHALNQMWPDDELPDRRQDALLVLDELVTNAVRHVGHPFTVALGLGRQRLLVAVTDTSRLEPVVRPLAPTAGSGRGLQIVQRLSHDWGVRLILDRGKTVWATLPGPPVT